MLKLIMIFLNLGMQHNFEKYTTGQVQTLSVNEDFYDYDVSAMRKHLYLWKKLFLKNQQTKGKVRQNFRN